MSAVRRQHKATEPGIMTLLADFFAPEPQVLFAYLFGSQARRATGPLSDLDLAVYLDEQADHFATRVRLMAALAKKIHTENFDLVVLNKAPVVLQYEVVKGGVVLKEDKPRRVVFETNVLRTYLDTQPLRETQYRYLKASLLSEEVHG